ncbi:tape measure protein [Castellaniella hirudinis]|uniref:tape measure protein n=1 Tax=Castellaniella hirudinis TaxID=1144617 RepID=UPI0039C15DB2
MAGNGELKLALRITATVREALAGLLGVSVSLDGVDDSAKRAGTGARSAADAIAQAGTAADRATRAISQNVAAANHQGAALGKLTSTVKGLASAYLGLSGIKMGLEIVDTIGQVNSRLKNATSSTKEYEEAQQRLMDISNRVYKPFEQSAELFIRTNESLTQLKYTTSESIDFIEALSYGMAASATDSVKAASAIDAVSKSIMNGKMGIEQYRTLINSVPRLQKALGDALGMSNAELDRLARTTGISIPQLMQLRTQIKQLGVEVDAMPVTVLGDAMVRLRNAALEWAGANGQASQTAEGLVSVLGLLADNFDLVARGIGAVAAILVTRYVAGVVLAAARTTQLAAANRALAASAVTAGAAQTGLIAGLAAKAAAATTAAAAVAKATLTLGGLLRIGLTLGRGLMALAGGPFGLLIAAIWGAYEAYRALTGATEDATKAQEQLAQSAVDAGSETQALTAEQQQAAASVREAEAWVAEMSKTLQDKLTAAARDGVKGLQAFKLETLASAAAAGMTAAEIDNLAASFDAIIALQKQSDALDKNKPKRGGGRNEALDFVKQLERQAAQAGKTAHEVALLEVAEKKLTGALRTRALAAIEAQRAIAAQELITAIHRQAEAYGKTELQVQLLELAEKRRRGVLSAAEAVEAEAAARILAHKRADDTMREIDIEYLRASGQLADAAFAEIRNKYEQLREELVKLGRTDDVAKLDLVIDTSRARAQVDAIQTRLDAVYAEQSRQEQSVQAQQQAGLLTEVGARERLLSIHSQTATKLMEIRPLLAEIAAMPGAIGEAARAALQELDNQVLVLKSTTTLLAETLKTGITEGLSGALQGLANGTMTLSEAINHLALTVVNALAQMAAEALAQSAMQGVMGLFGGGDAGDGGASKIATAAAAGQAQATPIIAAAGTLSAAGATVSAGAMATSTSAGLMTSAGATMTSAAAAIAVAAVQLQAAATTLMAANAMQGAAGMGFAAGGWTGRGSKYKPAGIVHAEEFVARREVVRQPGARSFLERFNRVGMQSLRGYAAGGLVHPPERLYASDSPPADASAARAAAPGNQVAIRVVPVLDESVMTAAMASAQGEKVITAVISRNASTVRQILGV